MFPKEFDQYYLWARQPVFKKRLERAKDTIKRALDLNIKWYCACSGGKDSVAMTHLINTIGKVPVWSEKDDMDFPNERDFMTNLAKQYQWDLTIVSPPVSLWDEIKRLGIDICEDIHSRGTAFSDQFFYALVETQESKNDGAFMGLRAEESLGRMRNYGKRSDLYQKNNGKWACTPVVTWTGKDVFAYLVSNQIPILDVYFKTKFVGGNPEKIRKSWILPSARAKDGHVVWLRYYYPELYAKLCEVSPTIRNYS